MHASGGGIQSVSADPYLSLDGRLNAPVGTPQFPNILSGYAKRPAWLVSSVDYSVGIPAGTTLNAPSTLSGIGLSVNTSTHIVTVTGSSPAPIVGIDFSLNGGWKVQLSGCDGAVLKNCNFAIGANGLAMISGDVAGTNNTTITNCVIDGGGLNDDTNNANVYLQGNVTGTYNLIKNAAQDSWDCTGSGATLQTVTLKYNVFYNSGVNALDTHNDWIQLGGGTYTVDIEFNLFYQIGNGTGTQGIMPEITNGNGSSIVGANVIKNNTIIALTNAKVNFEIAAKVTNGVGGSFFIDSNYIDSTGVISGIYKEDVVTSGSTSTSSPTIGLTASVPGWIVSGVSLADANNGHVVGTVSNTSGSTITLTANAAFAIGAGDHLIPAENIQTNNINMVSGAAANHN